MSFEGRSPKQIAHGQAYVALSRVTTLEGLFLLNFDGNVIHSDPMVDLEMQSIVLFVDVCKRLTIHILYFKG